MHNVIHTELQSREPAHAGSHPLVFLVLYRKNGITFAKQP